MKYKKKISINDITIRDWFQSIDTDQLTIENFDNLLKYLSKIKFDSYEVLSGYGYEKMLENKFGKSPFDIIKHVKDKIPKSKLQILIGAKNLVGLEIYSKNIISKFIDQSIKSGVDVFRVYDSLNDFKSLEYTIKSITDKGSECQCAVIYDDLQGVDYYKELIEKLTPSGCSSFCIKDVESTLLPKKIVKLFKGIDEVTDSPLYLSVYNLRGLQTLNYYIALENGCCGFDMSFIPSSYSDYNPAIFSFLLGLKGYKDLEQRIDYLKVIEAFEDIRRDAYPYISKEALSAKFIFSTKNRSLLPKWLISNIYKQLHEIGETDKMNLVLDEVFRIKNETGNPSLSTPVGQIIGSQAILNSIVSDYRWEIISDEVKRLSWGYYGRLPRNLDLELDSRLSEDSDEVDRKIRLEVEDIYGQCAAELKDTSTNEEDILSYCFFPEKTLAFLKEKDNFMERKPASYPASKPSSLTDYPFEKQNRLIERFDEIDIKKLREITDLVETTNVESINLELEGVKISINKSKPISEKNDNIKEAEQEPVAEVENNILSEGLFEIKAPIVGTFYRAPSPDSPPFVKVGDKIKKGDVLCIIEAMKLMNKIVSEHDGKVKEILLKDEDPVGFDQVLFILEIQGI